MQRKHGIGGHQAAVGRTEEWLTPKYIIDALGPFDLDPACPAKRPWPTAKEHYTIETDGLKQTWCLSKFIFLNPPDGQQTHLWLEKMAHHGHGIALIFARTETEMFHKYVFPKAECLFFFQRRLHFCHPDGREAEANAGGPSVLVAYGKRAQGRIALSGLPGHQVNLR